MPEIIIIGAAILDILVRPADERVFRTGSYSAEDIRMSTGGDALNEAVTLAGLGKSVRLETIIGKDRAGKYLETYCREKGIEISEGCAKTSVKTGINVVLIGEEGQRSFLTNRNGSLRALRISDITMPFPKETKLLCFASIFVSPHMGPSELEILFSQAKKQGITVCADMTRCKNKEKAEDLAPAFRYVDYLFANEEEAALLTGLNSGESPGAALTEAEACMAEGCMTDADLAERAGAVLLEAGAGCVIIKCGARGCYVRDRKREFWCAAAETVCVDTTGAGDSFVAGFLYKLSEKYSLEECAEFANLCGARSVSTVGATEWLAQRSGGAETGAVNRAGKESEPAGIVKTKSSRAGRGS